MRVTPSVLELGEVAGPHFVTSPRATVDAPDADAPPEAEEPGATLKTLVADYERRLIVAALAECGGSQTRAARRLRVKLTTLHEKIRRYGIRGEFLPAVSESERSVRVLADSQFQWRGFVPPGGTLEVNGVSGTIVAERAADAEVGLAACKRGGRKERAALSVVESPRGVVFSVLRVDGESAGESAGTLRKGLSGLRVDFRLAVPSDIHLVLNLLAGDIEVIGVAGHVEAKTLNGRVAVKRAPDDAELPLLARPR